MSDSPPFPHRALDRFGASICSIIWQIDRADTAVVKASREMNGNWFFFPASVSLDLLQSWRDVLLESDALMIGVDSDELVARRDRALRDRLDPLGRSRCEAVILQDADPDALKAGRPFHRLTQLRDAGLARHIFLEATSSEVAEWMVENTSARAVSVPLDLSDQTAKFRLIDTAREMETNLLSRRATMQKIAFDASREDDLSFRISQDQVAAVIEPLPRTVEALERIARALSTPMPKEKCDELWREFQSHVPAPPKPKRGHPPEYGA